jgi:hypothetical protein
VLNNVAANLVQLVTGHKVTARVGRRENRFSKKNNGGPSWEPRKNFKTHRGSLEQFHDPSCSTYSIAATLNKPCTESLSHNLFCYSAYWVQTGYMCFMVHLFAQKTNWWPTQTDENNFMAHLYFLRPILAVTLCRVYFKKNLELHT